MMVERVEALLKELGFRQYRVRYHDQICRIEVRPADLPRLVGDAIRQRVVTLCHEVGFSYVTLDLQGYRQGALNEGLEQSSSGDNSG